MEEELTSKSRAALNALVDQFSTENVSLVSFHGEEIADVAFDCIHDVLTWLKDNQSFDMLVDLMTVDHLGDEKRYAVSYVLSRSTEGTNVLIRTTLPSLEVPTASDLWASANWFEREAFDMMGVQFVGHPDLRRLLMWDEYPYHPLRKDFPLAGIPTDTPEVATTEEAPYVGGPFVATCGAGSTVEREPRSRQ